MPLDFPVRIPPQATRPFAGTNGRGFVYCRVSGEDDPRTVSLESQAQPEVDVLVADGYHLDQADVEFERFSGVNSIAHRDGLLRALDLIEQGYYQAFAIHDPDRLVRGVEVYNIIKQIEEAGCVVYINGKVSIPSDERDILLIIGGYASKKESTQIAERILRCRTQIYDRNEWVGTGGSRYGMIFDKATRTRSAHPEYGPVVVRAFTEIAAGVSTIRLAKLFNAEGIPAPGVARASKRKPEGKKYLWSAARIGFIIREEAYLGKFYRNRYRYKLDAKGRVIRKGKRKLTEAVPRAEWIECAFGKSVALVSQDLWDSANAALDAGSTRKADTARQATRPYLLRGFLYCTQCRQRMHPGIQHVGGKGRGHKYAIYRCKSKYNPFHGHEVCKSYTVHANKIEAMIRPIIDTLISDPELIEHSIDLAYRADGNEDIIARELARTRESIDKFTKLIDRYAEDLEDADMPTRSRKAIRDKMRLTEDQIDALEANVAEYQSRLGPLKDRDRLKRLHKEQVALIRDRLAGKGTLTMDEYRLAMEGLGIRFYYLQGKLDIELQPGVEIGAAVGVLRSSSTARRRRKDTMAFRPVKIDANRFLEAAGSI